MWGVGPKIGGNSAGLLNFGRQLCPYDLVTPWEFGTRRKSKQRQVDYQLEVSCQKSFDWSNLTSKHDVANQLKRIFASSSTTITTSPQKIQHEVPFHNTTTTPLPNMEDNTLPECGGVRTSAALDNIFGKIRAAHLINKNLSKF